MQKFMASKKNSNPINAIGLKVTGVNVVRIKDIIGKFLVLQKISSVLSIIFYVIWIPVGIFFLWFIVANFKLGAFDQLMKPRTSQNQPTAQTPQTPAETIVPGVGKVNVNCVQTNLPEEVIIKIVQDKGTQNLTDDEKSKLEPCIIEAEQSTPEASPQS